MALPKLTMPGMPGGASGAEMMLKSLGLGEMVEFAKNLAASGVVDKIVQFSEGIDELNNRLAAIEAGIARLGEHGLRTDASPSGVFGEQLGHAARFIQAGACGVCGPGVACECPGLRRAEDEPAPAHAASGGLAELPDVGLSDSATAGGSSGAPDARASNGPRGAGRSRTAASRGSEE